jgi:magnesium transporter
MKALSRAEEAAPSPQALLEAIANVAARRREGEGVVDERALAAEAQDLLHERHPADMAYVLEGLPLEDRLWIWGMVRSDHDGEILLEVSDAVRDTLLQDMDSAEMVAAAQNLDADEIADLAPDLPREVVQDIIESQDVEDRAQLQSALSYPEGTVGSLMDFEVVSVREDVTVEAALGDLRRFDELPAQTDALFVVDRDKRLKGTLTLTRILVSDPDVEIAGVYEREVISFAPESDADEAAHAFDRYDLVCAPVIDGAGRIIGRITVDTVLEYVRDRQEAQALGKVGLREEEDIFSSVWASAKNRGGSR